MNYSSESPDFSHQLVDVRPREISGATSSNRFAYQGSFGLCLTLELHEGKEDYCVLFDVHDDILALNHSTLPTKGRFYQVKSKKNGNWTRAALLKQALGKDKTPLPSILGKLYDHHVKFGNHVERLTFVSNANFSVKMADSTPSTDHTSICLNAIKSDELKQICDHLKQEFSLTSSPAGIGCTFLETTPLSLGDHVTHCEGRVSDFLEKQDDGTIPVAAFHRTLRTEVQRRSNREGRISDLDDLIKLRGLTRKQLQDMINSVKPKTAQNDLIDLIRAQIIKESFPLRKQQELIANARSFLGKRVDPTNLILLDAMERVRDELQRAPTSIFDSADILTQTISYLETSSHREFDAIRRHYPDNFLHGIFVVMSYEHEISETSPQSEEKDQ